MTIVSIRDAKNRPTELARLLENGETIVVTCNGRPVFDLVPHRPHAGLRLDAVDAFKVKHGITHVASFGDEDFDDPLPEDFLLKSLPIDAYLEKP